MCRYALTCQLHWNWRRTDCECC